MGESFEGVGGGGLFKKSCFEFLGRKDGTGISSKFIVIHQHPNINPCFLGCECAE